VKHFRNKEDLRHCKSRLLFVITRSWRFNFRWVPLFWTLEKTELTHLIMYHRFWFKRLTLKILIFFHFRWRMEVTADMRTPYHKYNWKIYHPWKFHDSIFHSFWENGKAIFEHLSSISHDRMWFFPFFFYVVLDIYSVYNIYQFQVKHFSNKKDLRHWKLRIWNFFCNNRKLTLQLPVDPTVWTFEMEPNIVYKLQFKRLSLTFLISFITSGLDRKWQPTCSTPSAHPNWAIYHPWKLHNSIFHRFWENCWTKWLF
jgi:hypothetical protein